VPGPASARPGGCEGCAWEGLIGIPHYNSCSLLSAPVPSVTTITMSFAVIELDAVALTSRKSFTEKFMNFVVLHSKNKILF